MENPESILSIHYFIKLQRLDRFRTRWSVEKC